MFPSTTTEIPVTPVISQYAATTIGIQCGPEAIKKFMTTLQESSNPALNGWMLEIVFFASLRNGGVTTVDDAAGNTLDKWSKASIVVSDGVPTLSTDHVVWIKPVKWNRGGYDAIMVCKRTQHVRMVQVTSAHTHTFRIDLFYMWLRNLSRSAESFEVKTLEIVFLVERKVLTDFKITKVDGEGKLVPFGWSHGEEKELVTRVGIKGLFEP
ncbi:hypothetical protein PHYPSEUDO_011483 [Phytophthora pseudosyringae]|uniref:Uncharacterized protein n=1 Tax=Phytophthora pseudosyringae TaxID=221518 RepID=A0A8T1VBD9_9STRA|nr:hypothetical protein PHYPSEUDO_011483 [Phytophthora pseudosyringae]